jgi:parvulin-like peptidyl-prolyl isomerase
VPGDAVAVVGDQTISKKELDAVLGRARTGFKAQKRPFPAAGSAEYRQLKNQALQFLVQRAELEQKAKDFGLTITDKQINDRVGQIKKQLGGEKGFQQQMKANGLNLEQVRSEVVRPQLVSEGIYKKVTQDVKVSDADVSKYYKSHQSTYGQPESRDVRHILVPTKAQADKLYAQIKAGADFAALAKKFSKDPGSAAQGGKLTVVKGQTVGPFDQTAFLLDKGQVSRPVKTQYGYHIIQALSAIKPAQTTPLAKVKDAIRQQLLQQRKNDVMAKWVAKTKKDYAKKIHYQVGYAPPPSSTRSTSTG